MTEIVCPIQPHEIDKKMLRGMESIVERVTAAAVIQGRGKDLLLRVYLAGLYHGQELAPRAEKTARDYNY